MIVAVASPLSPPQHCPIFGHRASSHTVCRFSPRRSFLILLYEADVGTLVFKYFGNRSLQGYSACYDDLYEAMLTWSCCPAGPAAAGQKRLPELRPR